MKRIFLACVLVLGASMSAQAYDSNFEYADSKKPVDFQFVDGDGRLKHISDFKGKVIFLKVWSIACGPCLGEMPFIESMARNFSNDDLEIIALNVDPRIRLEGLKEFYKEKQFRYLEVFYDGALASKTALGWTGFPTIYIIDREGKLVGSRAGVGRWDSPDALKFIREMVKGKRPSVGSGSLWAKVKSFFVSEPIAESEVE